MDRGLLRGRNKKGDSLRDSNGSVVWGQLEKIGKGTKASYDADKQVIILCFNKSPQTSGEILRKLREQLLKELKDLGYVGKIKFNGEVIVDNVAKEDVVLVKKNHKLIIHLNQKTTQEPPKKE